MMIGVGTLAHRTHYRSRNRNRSPAQSGRPLARTRGRHPCIVIERLHLDDAALRQLALARAAPLHLPGGVEREVGVPRAQVGGPPGSWTQSAFGLSAAPAALNNPWSGP